MINYSAVADHPSTIRLFDPVARIEPLHFPVPSRGRYDLDIFTDDEFSSLSEKEQGEFNLYRGFWVRLKRVDVLEY